MRISDWSSDVCSSDLKQPRGERTGCGHGLLRLRLAMTANTGRHLRYGSDSSPPLVTLSPWRKEQQTEKDPAMFQNGRVEIPDRVPGKRDGLGGIGRAQTQERVVEIGRARWRERVCIRVDRGGGGDIKKKKRQENRT